jgi:hypothetical protein
MDVVKQDEAAVAEQPHYQHNDDQTTDVFGKRVHSLFLVADPP